MQHAETPPLALQLLFVGKHLDYLIERRLANRGLNRTQTIVLTTLRRKPGLKANDLCGPAWVEPANVTRTLQSLERLGLLERRPHPTDGRASLLYLTPSGEALARELSEEVHRMSAELLEGVDPEDLPHLESALAALRKAIGKRLSSGGCQPSALSHQPSAVISQPSAPGTVEPPAGRDDRES